MPEAVAAAEFSAPPRGQMFDLYADLFSDAGVSAFAGSGEDRLKPGNPTARQRHRTVTLQDAKLPSDSSASRC